jgi:para-aminobenzoate synthetase component 1
MTTQAVELPVAPTTLLTQCAGEPYAFALDGGTTQSWGDGMARLGFGPRAVLRVAADGTATVVAGGQCRCWEGDPFDLLERFCSTYGSASDDLGAVSGGVIAALSYDLRCYVERLAPPRSVAPAPLLHAAAYDWLLSYSYATRLYTLASPTLSGVALNDVARHLNALARQPRRDAARHVCVRPDWSKGEYDAAMRTILEYIAAGDVYQVNLAQRFVAGGAVDAATLFADMQQRNPVPYAAYVDIGDCTLVSSSPECFLKLRGRSASTYPIKGTRPRGDDRGLDEELARTLPNDPKERAEHVMIVDLERNDLGRVCETGSVRVAELGRVHTFPNLHHMVSIVRGELRPGCTLAATLRAMFPGGSITGAPKVRAMQIIDEIEPVNRGFYTGAIGMVRGASEATFNLAIRTAVVSADRVTYHAGGGIVADSHPDREHAETLLKAEPFLAALTGAAA